jgi:hypothetical protein
MPTRSPSGRCHKRRTCPPQPGIRDSHRRPSLPAQRLRPKAASRRGGGGIKDYHVGGTEPHRSAPGLVALGIAARARERATAPARTSRSATGRRESASSPARSTTATVREGPPPGGPSASPAVTVGQLAPLTGEEPAEQARLRLPDTNRASRHSSLKTQPVEHERETSSVSGRVSRCILGVNDMVEPGWRW